MRYVVAVLLLFIGISYASAQDVYTSSGKTGYQKKTKKKKGYDPDKLILGGGLNAGFGSGYADVGISPMVGYRFTKHFEAGVGVGYEYSQAPDYEFSTSTSTYYDKANIVYPNIWTRVFVWRNLYVTGTFEYDLMSLKAPVADYTSGALVVGTGKLNIGVPCLLLGLGLRQPISGRVSFFVEADYDALQQEYSPYYGQFPIFRAGIATGL